MKVYILTSVNYDLANDQRGYENAEDILYSGLPSLSLEEAQAKGSEWAREEAESFQEDDEEEASAVPELTWAEDHANEDEPPLRFRQWGAYSEELNTRFLIREFDAE